MRVILAYLALAQMRLALFDLARSQMLDRRAADALARAQSRLRDGFALAERAGLSRR